MRSGINARELQCCFVVLLILAFTPSAALLYAITRKYLESRKTIGLRPLSMLQTGYRFKNFPATSPSLWVS